MSIYSDKLDFTGKNVIVTGGLSGAGRAIAEVFIQAGANVILTYNHSSGAADEMIAAHPGCNIRCCHLDQSDLSSIEEFARELGQLAGCESAALTGLIDCLVNNAGIYPACPVDEITPEGWDAMMDTNARGVFFLCKSLKPLMRKGSSIVNISSINATNPARLLAHYGASKAAVEMMTRSLAQSYGPEIRVNCIAPGLIYKEGQDEFIPGWADSYRERSPLGRLVQAEEIGKTSLFLASDLASAITGQIITVDCGIMLAPCFFNE